LLSSLGQTPDEIANTLIRQGVRGQLSSVMPNRDPVSVWLRPRLPETLVLVNEAHVTLIPLDGEPGVSVDTPAPVGRFLWNFEHDHYPLLTDRRWERIYPVVNRFRR
jgi:hypothetical protein